MNEHGIPLRTRFYRVLAEYVEARAEELVAHRIASKKVLATRAIVVFIDEERKRQKMTSSALNERAGYSKSLLSNMRHRRQRTTIETAEDYLNVLGYTLAVAKL